MYKLCRLPACLPLYSASSPQVDEQLCLLGGYVGYPVLYSLSNSYALFERLPPSSQREPCETSCTIPVAHHVNATLVGLLIAVSSPDMQTGQSHLCHTLSLF
mmetsp:Transcript_57923/g.135430  ORF Transcript_57923/g.135430 Transcript_57923/m.135430 type:complete len:102 (-) Transcript_57923:343-648(-)